MAQTWEDIEQWLGEKQVAADQLALARMICAWSEMESCARWDNGIEFRLWFRNDSLGQLIRNMAHLAGGMWHFQGEPGNKADPLELVFLPLREWDDVCEARTDEAWLPRLD